MTQQNIHKDSEDVTEQGKVFAIKGEKASTSMMLISLAERLSAHRVLFIDAAHCFNQMFVKKHGKKKMVQLKDIFIARPFTFDQYKSIINKLGDELKKRRANAVIISGFDRFLLQREFSDHDRLFFAESLLAEIVSETKMRQCVTIIGLSKDSPIEKVVERQANLVTSV